MAPWWLKEEAPEWDEERAARGGYTNRELELMADDVLKKNAKHETCRECHDEGSEIGYGEPTGETLELPITKADGSTLVQDGAELWVRLDLLRCPWGHEWWQSEGRQRGGRGANAFLTEEHLIKRRSREIHTKEGTPDPNIVQGIYRRSHVGGRSGYRGE